jgi:hypothetical protein
MQDPIELCNQLDEVVKELESTPATEQNLQTIKDSTARGFRALAGNIREAYDSSRAPQTQPPQQQAPAPAATVQGQQAGVTEAQQPAPEAQQPAPEGATD